MMPSNANAPRFGPSLGAHLLLYALASLWIDFGHVHRWHHSDTFVFSLASLDLWTPFYWEQDRVGMLCSLMTSWCRDPFATLMMQTWVFVFSGLCVPLLLAELFFPDPLGRAAAALSNALLLTLAPDLIRNNVLFETCYPQAMALGCAGLIFLYGAEHRPRAWRYVAAAAALALAHWTYLGVCVWLLPLAVGLACVRPRGAPWAAAPVAPVLVVAAAACGLAAMHAARGDPALCVIDPTPEESIPFRAWPLAWETCSENLVRWPGMRLWAGVSAGAAALGFVGSALLRGAWNSRLASTVGVLLLVAVSEWVAVCSRYWSQKNGYPPRYLLGSVVASTWALSLLALSPFHRWASGTGRRPTWGVTAALMLAAATRQYGLPSPCNPRADLDALAGDLTHDLLEAEVDGIGGDYWSVWQAVFHHRLATGRKIYGFSYRSGVFRQSWERTHPHGLRIAVPRRERDVKVWLEVVADRYGLSAPVKVGEVGKLDIYTTRPAVPAGP